jgi:RHS repeat-associated protein
MKTANLKHLSPVVYGAFVLCFHASALAQLNVERVQRDFQARYHIVTGGYLAWPKCSAGESPAPQFPKDGFYGDISQNPDKGVEIVTNLVQNFYIDNIIYTGFVNLTNGFDDLEGASNIVNYTEGDMVTIDPSEVDVDNFQQKLQVLETQILRLQFIRAASDLVNQVSTTNSSHDLDAKFAEIEAVSHWDSDGNLDFVPALGDVQDCAVSLLSGETWATGGDGYLDYTGCGSLPSTFVGVGTAVGRWITTYTTDYGPGQDPDARYYLCWAENHRVRIHSDLTRFAGGTAKIYLKLTAAGSHDGAFYGSDTSTNFAETRPTSAAQDTFGLWSAGQLFLGSNSNTDYITYSDVTPVPILGSGDVDSVETFGWKLLDHAVIVAPDFTTVPDRLDCCSCAKCDILPSFYLQSIHFNIPLGSDNFGSSAGALALNADLPSLALATPAALRYTFASTVQITTNSSGPLTHIQFKTSQVLVDVLTNNSFKYTISVNVAADAGSPDTNGFYWPGPAPFTTIVIENPDANTNSFDHLKITTTTDGNSTVTDYIYTTNSSGQWEMDTGNGLRKESRVSLWDIGQTNRTETVTVSNSLNQVVYKEINNWRLFPWGQERLTNVVDPTGAKLTNTWSFYGSTNDGGSYRLLQQETDSSGHWISYQYDENGRETNRVAQFLNSSVGSSAGSNRVTITIYSTNEPQITIVEKLLGTEISRRYQIIRSGEVDDIQCQTSGAALNASDNLTNIVQKYTNGSFAGQLRRIQHPDGTVQLYSYSTNATTKTATVLSGVPESGNETNIVDGTLTITITQLGGQVLTNTVKYRTPGSSDILIDQDSYTYLDARNRSYNVVHLDGTTNQYNYACCGLDSESDRDGTTTQYAYDDLKRQITSTRNGITTSNIFDANSAVLATIRIGSNSSQIKVLQQIYDAAGRVLFETNALSSATIHTNYFDGSGQTVRQTTYANGGTRVETYYKDGSLLSVTGTAVQPVSYLYGVDGDGTYTVERRLDAGGGTNEWIKTYTDMVGRAYKTVYATGAPTSISYYNVKGQLTNQIDPDGVSTILAYNAKGEQTHTVLNSNRDSTIDFSGADRIAFTTNDVVADSGTNVRRVRTYVWSTSADSPTLISTAETSVDGLQSWNIIWNNGNGITNRGQTFYDPAHGLRVLTNTAPDGSYTVTTNKFGWLISVTSRDSAGSPIGQTIHGYDGHGRQNSSTDARNGTTTYYFNNADQISGMVTPVPGAGQSAQATTNFFDAMGRIIATKLPDNTYVTNNFDVTGLLTNTFGSRTYPVLYTYDVQGRMKTMKTWKNFAENSGPAITTWAYDGDRGWLTNKTYDGSAAGSRYTYTAAGRLQTRLSARGTTTTYSYNSAGDFAGISYSDGVTPTIGYAYDRRGRQIATTNGTAVCLLTLDDVGSLLSESNIGGPLDGLAVTNIYDSLLRRTTNGLWNGSSWLTQIRYTYNNASRLQTVISGTNSASYTYSANSPLVSQVSFTNGSVQRMTTTKQYDLLNRLTNISSASSLLSSSFTYAHNSANQRTRRTEQDSSYWNYQYDSLGQVTAGKRFWSDGTPVAGQQFEYAFDDIGNRRTTANGGDQYGANLRYASYSANNLNELTSRTAPGFREDLGSANSNATVTIWSSDGSFAHTYRRGDYFRAELPLNNSTGALWLTLTNLAVLANGTNADIITNTIGNLFLPQTPEAFGYDADGNLTNDGRFAFTWEAENRASFFTSLATAPSASRIKTECTYDYLSRRTQKVVSTWNGSAYVAQSTNRFIYDGWNLMALLNETNGLVDSFMWGSDASGTMQGAGGVGGLLSMTVTTGPLGGTYFYAYDGNFNVASLVNAADGTVAAQYEYGPFGEPIRATAPLAFANPLLFSTKFCDWETGFYYYGYRYYNPSNARWLNRDPLGIKAGLNPYGMVGNNPLGTADLLGLILCAFDGTGNDASQDLWRDPTSSKNSPTSVRIMYELYDGTKIYKWGVGTRTDVTSGNLFGNGVGERIDDVLQVLKKYSSKHPDEPVDIIGFSRGAAAARVFANRVAKEIPCLKIRFLGLLDTVAQIGVPNDFDYQFGYDLSVHPENVLFTAHAVAENEYRSLFPLTSISASYEQGALSLFLLGQDSYSPEQFKEIHGPNYWEKPFPGAHSDIGGGYQDTRNVDALTWMIEQGQEAGAPFSDLESYQFFDKLKQLNQPHDSRYPLLDRVPWSSWGSKRRAIFPGNIK